MVEIKCPLTRKIKTTGKNIVPLHYWVQVQLQLEACDLDECDFLQCSICEYEDKTEFLEDTDNLNPNKSKKTGLEKGCIIQLIKSNIMNYEENIYEYALFIYPGKLTMIPEEYDEWISDNTKKYKIDPKFTGYKIDKVIYWRLEVESIYLIKREKEWFLRQLPTFERMWNYVTYFREHTKERVKLIDYIKNSNVKDNTIVMGIIERIYNEKTHDDAMNEIEEIIKDDGYIPFD